MKLGEFTYGFLMKGLCVGRLVEIQIASEYLVSSFARQHHLDAHRTNDASQQVHGCGCTNRSDIIRLSIVNHIADSIEAFLDGVVHLVVYGSDIIGNLACLSQIGCTLQPYSEAMQAWPPSIVLVVRLYTLSSIELCDGRHDRTV